MPSPAALEAWSLRMVKDKTSSSVSSLSTFISFDRLSRNLNVGFDDLQSLLLAAGHLELS